MKKGTMLLCVLVLSSVTLAQEKRLLVGSNGDVIPLKKGESAYQAIQQVAMGHGLMKTISATCTNPMSFGFDPAVYLVTPPGHQSNHKDYFANWQIVPTDGVIDTFYMYTSANVNPDSMVYLRIMDSRIYDGSGPGYHPYEGLFPGPLDPTLGYGPRCWGYFRNTNDLDGQSNNVEGGVAAFPEDATPPDTTAWVSSLQRQFPLAAQTFPPTGDEIWGLTGYPFSIRPNSIIRFNLHILGALPVHAGQAIFVTFRVPGTHPAGTTDPSETDINYHTVDPDANGYYHTHTWKFYEHGAGATGSTCGIPGWVDRGSWENLFWYSMTVSGNTPPKVIGITGLTTTFASAPRPITVDIEDCNFGDPGSAGVAAAHLAYSVDGGSYTFLPLNYIGGTLWQATIPAIAAPSGRPYTRTVTYYVAAFDNQGLANDTAITRSYKIVTYGTEWYYPDTASSDPMSSFCYPMSVKDSVGAHFIDTSAFFSPPFINATTNATNLVPNDDGTAGPFDLGGPFIYFGDTVRYAWIGVNGAIALSKTATDTIDVSSNGYYTDYDFPVYQRHVRCATCADTTFKSGLPRNFVGVFWNDMIYADSVQTPGTWVRDGEIYTWSDACRAVVEYDGIAQLDDVSGDVTPGYYFRVILNKCDGTVAFQYDQVTGIHTADTTATIALEGDSSASNHGGWLKFYRGSDNGPMEAMPRDGWCVRFNPTTGTAVASGWNILSVPVTPSIYSKTYLYPAAVSQAFAYKAGYVQSPTLINGAGYWMKFGGGNTVLVPGHAIYSQAESVHTDWNLVGAITKPVPTNAIIQTPSSILTSQYFGYNKGYFTATTLEPGKGYWIKSHAPGTLTLTASSIPKSTAAENDLSQLSSITIRDGNKYQQSLYIGSESEVKEVSQYELPPPAPEGVFDVRYGSQRMVETYPSQVVAGKVYEYPISVQTSSYPVTIKWQVQNTNGHTLLLTDGTGGRAMGDVVLNGSGSIRITNASIKSLVLKLVDGISIPKEFALSQNYPNPFNPTTRFNIDVPKTTTVDVVVYDILGQKITSLMSGIQSAGYHAIEWDGRDGHGLTVPSGMYFVRMTADNFSAVRKIMMLK